MAGLHDWVELGKQTVSSLKTSQFTNLYTSEWPQTREMLIAEHRTAIDGEQKRVRRFIRTRSAIMFGLAKRLAPHRRVIFLLTFIWFFVALFAIPTVREKDFGWPYIEVAASFIVMTLLLAMELMDKIKFRDELELARDLQANLLPSDIVQTDEYAIAAYNQVANTVGGDIYDFVRLPDGRIAILFGDASGHGMAAGLVMAVAHAAFRTQLDVDPSPDAIVGVLNRILCRTGNKRSFFSSCYVLLSPGGAYSATLAGHPQILHLGADGNVIERIGRGSYPLGIKTALTWETTQGTIAPGERLLFHSDGLTEARNANGQEMGDAYVESILHWNAGRSPNDLVQTIVAQWQAFTGGKIDDDVSVAVVERRS